MLAHAVSAFVFCKPILDDDIFSLDPAKLAQLLPERVHKDRATGTSACIQVSYAGDFPVCCASTDTQSAKSITPKLKARICFFICAVSQLSNNFVRPCQQVRWDRYPDLLRRLEIYHKLKFLRLLHRKIGG